jgi:nitrate reductase NapE component
MTTLDMVVLIVFLPLIAVGAYAICVWLSREQ